MTTEQKRSGKQEKESERNRLDEAIGDLDLPDGDAEPITGGDGKQPPDLQPNQRHHQQRGQHTPSQAAISCPTPGRRRTLIW